VAWTGKRPPGRGLPRFPRVRILFKVYVRSVMQQDRQAASEIGTGPSPTNRAAGRYHAVGSGEGGGREALTAMAVPLTS
jgi:hypothetical protein